MHAEDDDDVTRLRGSKRKPKLNSTGRNSSIRTTWVSFEYQPGRAELKMGSDQYRSPHKINCVLCKKSDEDEITGPLSSKQNISAHQNCLVTVACFHTASLTEMYISAVR